MTLAEIQTRITFYTKANTTNYPNADRLIAINKAVDDITIMILQSQDEWDYDDTNQSDFPILTTDLVTSQQDYKLPINHSTSDDDILKIKRIEINYGSDWERALPLDINEDSEPTDTSSVANNYDSSSPKYDFQYGSIFLYPIPSADVIDGLKIWINRSALEFTSAELTAGTKTPGFDKQFHEMVALSVALDWAVANSSKKISTFKAQLSEYELKLKSYYSDKQEDRVYAMGNALPDDYGD